MAELTAALLADFAQVRAGMLFVSSAGVSRLIATTFPSQLRLYVALMFEIAAETHDDDIAVKATVSHAPTATELGSIEASVRASASKQLTPGEPMMVPLALPLGGLQAQAEGPHDIRISVNGELARFLTLTVFRAVAQKKPGSSG